MYEDMYNWYMKQLFREYEKKSTAYSKKRSKQIRNRNSVVVPSGNHDLHDSVKFLQYHLYRYKRPGTGMKAQVGRDLLYSIGDMAVVVAPWTTPQQKFVAGSRWLTGIVDRL